MFKIKNIFSGKNTSDLYIPAGAIVRGDMEGSMDGCIAGILEGDISLQGKLVIEKTGMVKGKIQSHELIVHGKVFGNITCTHKTLITNSARVEGDIQSPLLQIEENATIITYAADEKREQPKGLFSIGEELIITRITEPSRVTNNEHTWF